MRRYGNFTPARRAALRKAQLASAAKRRGRGRSRSRTIVRRTAIGVGIAATVGTGVIAGRKIKGRPGLKSQGMISGPKRAISSGHPNRKLLNASNFAHTQEAKRVRKRAYLHTNKSYTQRPVSEAEATRRTKTYVSGRVMYGHKVSSLERQRVKKYYQGRTS